MELTPFENVVCFRCGGSGHYSFNMIHGTKCYGCNGAGKKYTKRGKAASDFFNDLLKKPVTQVCVGDLVLFDNYPLKSVFAKVEFIDHSNDQILLKSTTPDGKQLAAWYFHNQKIRMGWSKEQKAKFWQQALDYQATLTKSGTVSKRKVNS